MFKASLIMADAAHLCTTSASDNRPVHECMTVMFSSENRVLLCFGISAIVVRKD